VERDETGIIGGGSPPDPDRAPVGRFILEEAAWILGAFAVAVLAWTPGVALFVLHTLVGLHVVRSDRSRLGSWLELRGRDVLWGLAGGAVLLAFNGAYGWLLERMSIQVPDVADLLRGILPAPALFIWAALLAPVVEELYFRGHLLDAFTQRLGPVWAASITTIVFAAIHGIPAFLPAYLVFALLLLGLRRRTGRLVAPILAHMVNNAAALLLP
jgi:membrane protease YdiL (CAAX protease family)